MKEPNTDHFNKIFWFVVGICTFGAAISVYAIYRDASRIDMVLTFWLSTAVAGGIGYLIGSSANQIPKKAAPANAEGTTTTADISVTQTTQDPKEDEAK